MRRETIRALLVQPAYYTRYPPLGLLKLASWHREQGHDVVFAKGMEPPISPAPDVVEITSLFTYAWQPVHRAVEHYRTVYPAAKIRLGGIYATLMPQHARLAGADEVHEGLVPDAEGLLPDYSLVPEWDSSIMFGTRGCIRKCAFCAVPKLEGRTWGAARRLAGMIAPDHKKVVLWDNNILGVSNWKDVIDELAEINLPVDFNQGLDARLITAVVARELGRLRIKPLRMAYDMQAARRGLERAIPALVQAGFRRDRMVVYTLFNFTDTPEDFFNRVRDLLSWGVVCYPMRYEPLNSLTKNRYVSANWTIEQLEMVSRARRVIGRGGAFPSYKGLVEKFTSARNFEEAFDLRPDVRTRSFPKGMAGMVEEPTPDLSVERTAYRELLNDPTRLLQATSCRACQDELVAGERAFAVQDYSGRYVEYACPSCHPNRAWIDRLWQSTASSVASGGQLLNLPMLDVVFSRPAL